jgi:hypothetical protein
MTIGPIDTPEAIGTPAKKLHRYRQFMKTGEKLPWKQLGDADDPWWQATVEVK